MKKKEFKVGEVFKFGNVKLRCEESKNGGCLGCAFSSIGFCEDIYPFVGYCSEENREDKKNVIFVKVEG